MLCVEVQVNKMIEFSVGLCVCATCDCVCVNCSSCDGRVVGGATGSSPGATERGTARMAPLFLAGEGVQGPHAGIHGISHDVKFYRLKVWL